MSNTSEDRYPTLLSFLEQDPENVQLLRDTAEAALASDRLPEALDLLDRLAALRPLEPAETNLRAIAAMRSGQADVAAGAFAALRDHAPDDPALAFNHAWALSLAGRHDEAELQLSDESVAELPQAAMLQVQLAHQAGRFDEAAEMAQAHLARHPGYAPLQATVSVLAMDIDDEELARQCAVAGGDHPDALTTLGLLTLGNSNPAEATELFGKALASQPRAPRALIGMGLASLVCGKADEAGPLIDQGAEIFGTHLGSWIAAGWSYLLAGDVDAARARFERAMDADSNFAECHGSLAVMDVLDGNVEEAIRKCDTALRLDRQCFSAAFAKVLLASAEGDQAKAHKLFELALRQPIGNSEHTLADAIARMAV